jgi:tripartite-type tricarboxylate transporter receptor subunit TctC
MDRRGLLLAPLGMLGGVAPPPRPAWGQAGAVPPAAPWPSRPIRLVTPGVAGPLDVVARTLAEPLAAALRQPVVVEARVGAGTTLAAELVAHAPPDGHTLLVSNTAGQAIGPFVYPHVRYDPVRDFTHVALLAEVPLALAVNAQSAARTLAEFVAAARATAGGPRVGTQGNGTSSHVTLELLARLAGVEVTHVPYRPGTSVVADLLAGRIEAAMTSVVETGRNERLRLLAVAAPERQPGWPEVPTFREQGLPLEAALWVGLSGPAGLPDAIADRLHRHAVEALLRPEVRARLAALGAGPPRLLRREAFAGFVAEEVARWGEAVRAAGARAD